MVNSSSGPAPDLRVAIVGLGAIGRKVAQALDQGIDGLALVAVSAQNPEKHQSWLAGLTKPPAVLPIEALVDAADIVIECAPGKLVRSIVAPFVSNGKIAVVVSVGALLDNEDLIGLAKQHGGQIIVPTGALIGLDAVTAAAVGTIHSVRMVTRKPPLGLAGAPYIVEHNIDIEGLAEPLRVFEGTARDAAKGFPANLNVAVALSLAGNTQHASDRGRIRLGPVLDVDRKYSVGESQDRHHHGTVGHCLSSQAARAASRRHLSGNAFSRAGAWGLSRSAGKSWICPLAGMFLASGMSGCKGCPQSLPKQEHDA
jgi:aspartate dehydrogenase